MAIPLHKSATIFDLIFVLLRNRRDLRDLGGEIDRMENALGRIPLHAYIDWRSGRFDQAEVDKIGWILLNLLFQDPDMREASFAKPSRFDDRLDDLWREACAMRTDYILFLAALRAAPPPLALAFVVEARGTIRSCFDPKKYPNMNTLIGLAAIVPPVAPMPKPRRPNVPYLRSGE